MEAPSILVTNYLIPEVIDAARQGYKVTERYNIPPSELLHEIGKHTVLLCRSATKVTTELIEAAADSKLELIATATSGFDHIDVDSATRAGIRVCRAPFEVTNANAEYNIGAMIALSRNIVPVTHAMRHGSWNQQSALGSEINGKKLGLVGLGLIGKQTARYASAFDMDISAYDPYLSQEAFARAGVESLPLDTLLTRADYVVLNVPLTHETTNMLSRRELSLLKASSYLVQVSRGGVVNEDAFLDALEQERIAGAAIDVFVGEPAINPRFRELPNVILTPHVGCSTQESRRRVGLYALAEIGRYFGSEPLESEVTSNL